MKSKWLLSTGIMLATIMSNAALGAEFPDKPVTIVVGYSAGGSNDKMGRDIGQQLGEIWKQPVIIDNRPGAAGAIAAAHVAKARPDGYTLMVGPVTLTMIPAVQANLPFDLLRDFKPVALLATSPLALTVNASMKANSVNDFVKSAEQNELFSGTSGPGAVDYFATHVLMAKSHIKLDVVNYKGGSEILMDLMANRVNMFFGSVAMVSQQVRDGRLKVLAVTGEKRSAVFPKIPTFSESGIKGIDVLQWWGIFAPAGTPQRIVDKINRDINKSLGTEKIKKSFSIDGATPAPMTADEFGQFVKNEYDTWQRVAKNSGIGIE